MNRHNFMSALGAATAMLALIAGAGAGAGLIAPVVANASEVKSKIAIGHGFHVTMTAKPGMGDALIELLAEAPAFETDDCVIFLIGRSKANPDVIYLTEGWTSEQAHKAFTETERAKAYTARFGALVAGADYLDEVPIGGKAAID